MEYLISIGVAVSIVGIFGIMLSIVRVRRAKKTSQTDEDLRAAIQAVLPLNIGAFFVSVLGMMCVVIGVILT